MSGTLYVVATPIGNLEDITLRALRVLREVGLIAAEDTRRTARLLSAHGISTRTISFHEHNTRARLGQLLARLQAGESIALVTDAGTPSVSDPGLELVQGAIEQGIAVDPIPGPSAPLAALVASGFPVMPFTVLGFPPYRLKARTDWLEEACSITHTFCFFEAPHRLRATLTAFAPLLGNRPVCVAREITKLHQEFVRGTGADVSERLTMVKGEQTIVVGPLDKSLEKQGFVMSDADITDEFWRSTENMRGSRRELIAALARKSGRTAKDVYAAIERGKKLVD